MAIKLVIDSASDIKPQEAKKKGHYYLPMTITFGEKQFLDGIELSPNQFFKKLIETDKLPITSQITPYTFEKTFKKIIENGDTPLAITISSKLSGTYQSACIAADEFEDKAFVVDSLNACLGEAVLIYYAESLINKGLEIKEILDELNNIKSKIKLLALLDTLEYLKKGGRISSATAMVGGMLSLKPVVSIIDGEVKAVGKARGSKNGNNLLIELIQKSSGINFNMPYTLAYSGLDDTLLNKYIDDSAVIWKEHTNKLPIIEIGSTIGTHIGPGAIAIAFFANN